jgi:hypothetical protein
MKLAIYGTRGATQDRSVMTNAPEELAAGVPPGAARQPSVTACSAPRTSAPRRLAVPVPVAPYALTGAARNPVFPCHHRTIAEHNAGTSSRTRAPASSSRIGAWLEQPLAGTRAWTLMGKRAAGGEEPFRRDALDCYPRPLPRRAA